VIRRVTLVAGVALTAYGGWLLVTRQDPDRLVDVGVWLAGGVVLHDLVLAPAVVLCGLALARRVPWAARGPVVVGAVVLGPVTLLAVPVLGRFGARPDNPTLLDRPYWAGWLLLVAVTAACVAAVVVVRSRQRRVRPADGLPEEG
jgi:hypothetical protein